MSAQGQSFFQASGDGDAWCGSIWVPADSDYVTVVGGTELAMNGSGASYASEAVWNRGYAPPGWSPNGNGYAGSGGGISDYVAIPAWQQPIISMPNECGGSTSYRNIPDVAMVADNVLVVANQGYGYSMAGTSIAAPLWAGFAALINQLLVQTGGYIGCMNYALYSFANREDYSHGFHDITTGNNINPCSHRMFPAIPGYDLCTGLGSPTADLITLMTAY